MSVALSHRRSTGRAELYLVPPLPEVRDDPADEITPERMIVPSQRATGPAPAGPIPARPAPSGPAPGTCRPRRGESPPIRLTRRGRIVVGVLILAAFVGLAMAFGSATEAAAPSGPARTVVVRPGDTLWSIATAALPEERPYAAVERIRLLNHLPDDEIYAGEQLMLPPA